MPSLDPLLLPDEADLEFEEELLRNAADIKVWLRYLAARKDAVSRKRHLLYERAVAALPGSYKLWHAYLQERVAETRGLAPGSPAFEALHNTFERALVTMHKMPRVWELYLRSLLEQKLVTRTRRACDRALAALPVTQHERVWTIFLARCPPPAARARGLTALAQAFARQEGVPVETALRCVALPPQAGAAAHLCRTQGVPAVPEAGGWACGGVCGVPQDARAVERGGAAPGGGGQ